MILRSLTTKAMIALTEAWLDPERGRRFLEAEVATAIWLPTLTGAHDELVKSLPATTAEAAAGTDEPLDLALLHDRKTQDMYMVLIGIADLVDDRELRAGLYGLQDRLFSTRGMEDDPRNVSGEPTEEELLLASLSDEERAQMAAEASPIERLFDPYNELLDHVELVEQRLSDADRDQLASMVHPEGTLLKTYDECIGTARDLAEASKSTGADVTRARIDWARAVRTMVGTLELCPISEKDMNRMLEPLNEAWAKAEGR